MIAGKRWENSMIQDSGLIKLVAPGETPTTHLIYQMQVSKVTKSKSTKSSEPHPLVGVVMGSASDWETMRSAADILDEMEIPCECRVVSAHRMPDTMAQYGRDAQKRGLRAIIAGAGGAAHLPGMLAAHTTLPVLGVPVQSKALNGMDSLLSIVQMPAGIPVATFAIGTAGAKNAAIFAASLLAPEMPNVARALRQFRERQTRDAASCVLQQRLRPENP